MRCPEPSKKTKLPCISPVLSSIHCSLSCILHETSDSCFLDFSPLGESEGYKRKCPFPAGCPAHVCEGKGMDGVTCEGLGLPGLPACSGGDGNKEELCVHTLTLTDRTRPTQALSKNVSSNLVAKIKEPLGSQPQEEILLLGPLLCKGLCKISSLLLERIPG